MMRKLARYVALALALLLAAAGLYHGFHRDDAPVGGSSSAALGLMLLERGSGLYVLAVTQDSPADKADIRPGDTLVRLGENALHEVTALDALIETDIDALPLSLRRDGEMLQVLLHTR